MTEPRTDYHIFRDARRRTSATDLIARLRAATAELPSQPSSSDLLTLMLLAGELECGLADAGASAHDMAAAACLTDSSADAALESDSQGALACGPLVQDSSRPLADIRYRGHLQVSMPEGFAYYALHPLDYADLTARLPLQRKRAMVVGIRSIGTTLSAVVCAQLKQQGIVAERITVRPTGHPYDRACRFSAEQRWAIARALSQHSEFLVCDEGPGRSGSSLLCVAEALETQGVPAGRIRLLCSHQPDVNALCARDAGRRWPRYISHGSGLTHRLPNGAERYAGGGEWRRALIPEEARWPAVWPQMEHLRYLSADLRQMWTFEGHGPYGDPVHDRSAALADAGFGLPYGGQQAGFGLHTLCAGRLAGHADLTADLLRHMARYCAWRSQHLTAANPNPAALENMARINLEREFGSTATNFALPVERPVIADHRMAPEHWLLAQDGRLRKLDATIHGDDHFFPGPCDIAWDLAGVIVEWRLPLSARESLLTEYRRASGDDASHRVGQYELAYAVFRLAWSRMAAASVAGAAEEFRLQRDALRYREFLQSLPGIAGQPSSQAIPA